MDSNDKQIGGAHYKGKHVQPWDIVHQYGLDFYEGNVLKYLLRRKPSTKRITDLEKAKHYIEKKLELMYEERRSQGPSAFVTEREAEQTRIMENVAARVEAMKHQKEQEASKLQVEEITLTPAEGFSLTAQEMTTIGAKRGVEVPSPPLSEADKYWARTPWNKRRQYSEYPGPDTDDEGRAV